MQRYQNLSSPMQIGTVTMKNRMFMAPMDTGFGDTPYGVFTPAGVEYFARRAEGGFGLLFSGGTNADCVVDEVDNILNHKEEFIRVGRELNRRLEEYGTKMFIQLSMNVGRNGGLKSPSPLPALGNPSVITKELTVEEIHKKVEEAGQAAKLVKEAGYAGVDIHALHWGHLLDSFALSFMNHRTDEYGGSLENRLRFAKEIVQEIKKTCGEDFPVTMRLAVKSYMKDFDKASFDGSEEVGRTVEEAVEIAKLLESYGYDALSTDAGTLDAFYYAMPPSYVPKGYTLEMLKGIRKAVKIPILAGGRMADANLSEQAIADGIIDAVVLGRAAIADPDYAKLVSEDKYEQVRTCIGCNQGCIWGYFTTGIVGCAVNPEVGKEAERITEAADKRKVVIVGGGVAGMEAARVASLRGHQVILLEKRGHLGGNLIPAGAHDFKAEIWELNQYYEKQMELLKVDVRLNTEVTIELLKELRPDTVILAVGSNPIMPRLKGIDHEKTSSGVDILLGKKEVGDRAVVVGGGLVGCEIAYGLAKEGKQVTIVEALDEIMKTGNVPMMNKTMLLDAFEYYGTEILTSTRLEEINDKGAVVTLSDGTKSALEADNVIMSVGYRPEASMKEEVENAGFTVYEIGDGKQVGNVMTAIHQAYEAAKNL